MNQYPSSVPQKSIVEIMAEAQQDLAAKGIDLDLIGEAQQVIPPSFDPNPIEVVETPRLQASLEVPTKIQYWLQKQTKDLLTAVGNLQGSGQNINVLVTGPQGSGKSELVNQYAASHNRPLATIEVGRLSEVSQIFGYMDFKDGATHFVEGLFLKAIKTPYAVIHLQELNRPENDTTLNSIFSVLDDTSRGLWIDELQEWVPVATGVTIFASINEGFEFVGTQPLDIALRNRFNAKVEVGALPPEQELQIVRSRTGIDSAKGEAVIGVVNKLRNNQQEPIWVSVRDSINMARFVTAGLSIDGAIKAVIGAGPEVIEQLRLITSLTRETATNPHIEAYDKSPLEWVEL